MQQTFAEPVTVAALAKLTTETLPAGPQDFRRCQFAQIEQCKAMVPTQLLRVTAAGPRAMPRPGHWKRKAKPRAVVGHAELARVLGDRRAQVRAGSSSHDKRRLRDLLD
mgnify:CR=1 FL=1|jgi:hypothetical protein